MEPDKEVDPSLMAATAAQFSRFTCRRSGGVDVSPTFFFGPYPFMIHGDRIVWIPTPQGLHGRGRQRWTGGLGDLHMKSTRPTRRSPARPAPCAGRARPARARQRGGPSACVNSRGCLQETDQSTYTALVGRTRSAPGGLQRGGDKYLVCGLHVLKLREGWIFIVYVQDALRVRAGQKTPLMDLRMRSAPDIAKLRSAVYPLLGRSSRSSQLVPASSCRMVSRSVCTGTHFRIRTARASGRAPPAPRAAAPP